MIINFRQELFGKKENPTNSNDKSFNMNEKKNNANKCTYLSKKNEIHETK
jgi:hypothetical protein